MGRLTIPSAVVVASVPDGAFSTDDSNIQKITFYPRQTDVPACLSATHPKSQDIFREADELEILHRKVLRRPCGTREGEKVAAQLRMRRYNHGTFLVDECRWMNLEVFAKDGDVFGAQAFQNEDPPGAGLRGGVTIQIPLQRFWRVMRRAPERPFVVGIAVLNHDKPCVWIRPWDILVDVFAASRSQTRVRGTECADGVLVLSGGAEPVAFPGDLNCCEFHAQSAASDWSYLGPRVDVGEELIYSEV